MLGLSRSTRRVDEHGKTVLSVSDNLVEVLATEKGRSRDKELNGILRRCAGLQEIHDIMWRRRHIQGVRNVADFDSRLANRGLIGPGECLHPRALARRARDRGLPTLPLLESRPPALEKADALSSLLDETRVLRGVRDPSWPVRWGCFPTACLPRGFQRGVASERRADAVGVSHWAADRREVYVAPRCDQPRRGEHHRELDSATACVDGLARTTAHELDFSQAHVGDHQHRPHRRRVCQFCREGGKGLLRDGDSLRDREPASEPSLVVGDPSEECWSQLKLLQCISTCVNSGQVTRNLPSCAARFVAWGFWRGDAVV